MILDATPAQRDAILGAMLSVAATPAGTPITAADRASLAAVHRYLFRRPPPLDIARVTPTSPAELAASLGDRALAEQALRFLAVMALVDGTLDTAKIAVVLAYAEALAIDEPYLTEIAEAARGHLRWALLDMSRRNLESITGHEILADDTMPWFLPYRAAPDPALAARYRALAALPKGSFGRAYADHYADNSYAMPGETDALNEVFATPHDSAHVLAGYDTSPRGELLVSTFTAAMHKSYPMAGHILPVIFSWHLGIKINDVAGAATGALDPDRFWLAWARGEATATDVFAPGWDFWAATGESVESLRRRYKVPPLPEGESYAP